MAQGRGNACAAGAAVLLIVAVVGLCSHPASATNYTVGGAKGWDINVNYTSWAAGLTFKDGDVLFFPYAAAEHDVTVVDKAGYDSCSAANAIDTYSAGNTTVVISGTRTQYYICSFPGHCSSLGMKLAVTISAAATAPAPSPTAPPPSSPPPAPSTAPASPPPSKTPAPSPIRTPSTSPTPAPAPTPTAPAPSSAVTPTAPAPSSAETPTAPASSSTTPPPPATSPSPPPPPPSAAHALQLSAALASCLAMAAVFLAF